MITYRIIFFLLMIPLHAYQDAVTVSVSSVGWRKEGLKRTLETIIDQVDYVNVFLQEYDEIPDFLQNPKITVVRGEDYPQVLAIGAGAKFFWADKVQGYHFTIDDDILYPNNYVAYCINSIEQYRRKAVVGFHGSIFAPVVVDYFASRSVFPFIAGLDTNTPVHMIGTGTLAYHVDTITISMNDFPYRNIVDLFFALVAQREKIPMICLSRDVGYLNVISNLSQHTDSIFLQNIRNHEQHNSIVKAHKWVMYEPVIDEKI